MILSRRMLLVLLACAIVSGCSPRRAKAPIVIGQLAPRSGPEKASGEEARQGTLLAVTEVNQEGNRIQGRRVEVLHKDIHGDEQAVAGLTILLITVNQAVALISDTSSMQAEAIARAAQPYQVALVTSTALTSPLMAENIFSLSTAPEYQGQVLARFAAHEQKFRRVTIVANSRHAIGQAVAAGFTRQGAAIAGLQVDSWSYESEATLAELPARIRQTKPEAILLTGSVRDFVQGRDQLQMASIKLPLLFGGTEADVAALIADHQASQGVYLATSYFLTQNSPLAQKFIQKYREQFQEAPSVHAAMAYDAARLLFAAMQQSESLQAQHLQASLRKLEHFETLTGPLRFDPQTHSARRPLFILHIDQGKAKLVKPYDPETK